MIQHTYMPHDNIDFWTKVVQDLYYNIITIPMCRFVFFFFFYGNCLLLNSYYIKLILETILQYLSQYNIMCWKYFE